MQTAPSIKTQANGIFSVLTFCLVTAINTPAAANVFQFNGETGLGYLDNPLRLSEQFDTDGSAYWRNYGLIRINPMTNVKVSASVDHREFDSITESTSTRYAADASFDKALTESITLRVELDYAKSERTYVSRFTGERFKIDDEDASDRYNYQRWQPGGAIIVNVNELNRIKLYGDYRDQQYADLTELDLESLDYQQFRGGVEWRYGKKRQQIALYTDFRQRDFDTREGRDINGEIVDDSLLEYRYQRIGTRAKWRINRRNSLFFNASFTQREDNLEGYYDTDLVVAQLRWRHRFNARQRLTTTIGYTDLNYNRPLVGNIENEAEAPSSETVAISANYRQRLFKNDGARVYWFFETELKNVKADNALYKYDQYEIESGLIFRF